MFRTVITDTAFYGQALFFKVDVLPCKTTGFPDTKSCIICDLDRQNCRWIFLFQILDKSLIILVWNRLCAFVVMGILFIITGLLIVGIGYQVGKIYRKYCWEIISIVEVITSTAIAIYFGDWIKSVISINLITLLLLVHVVYIGIRCYVKDWMEERGYCWYGELNF